MGAENQTRAMKLRGKGGCVRGEVEERRRRRRKRKRRVSRQMAQLAATEEKKLWASIGYLMNAVFWDVTPRASRKNRRFGGTYRLHHQVDKNRRTECFGC
jgi:hypothetical protein